MNRQKIPLALWLGGIGILIPLAPWFLLKSGLTGPTVIWAHELLMVVCPPALLLLFISFFDVSSLLVIASMNSVLYACIGAIAIRLINRPMVYFAFLGLILISLRLISGVCIVLLASAVVEPANVSISECTASFASPVFLAVGGLITLVFVIARSRYRRRTDS